MTPAPEERATTVIEALSLVMDDVRAVGKHDRNTAQNFSFRGVDAVVNAVGPALRKHGVVVVPVVQDVQYSTIEVGDRRRPMGHVIVRVQYTFYGPMGDPLHTEVVGEAMDAGDKAVPKAMSVAFRTALLQALCLPTDEPDADSQVYERTPPPSDEEVQAWADRMATRIQECDDKDELRTLWREAVGYSHASAGIQAELKRELEQRAKDLEVSDDAA